MDHHSFSQGRPECCLFQEMSTQDIAPASRFDFWVSDVVRTFSVDSPNDLQRKDFRAKVISLATATGEMHYAESDGISAHLTAQTIRNAEFDELALMLMLDGHVQCTYECGEPTTIGKGGFFLLDGSCPTSIRFSRHTVVQLDLSRPLLKSLFPGAVPAPSVINAALANSRLAGLLRDHLRQFPRMAMGLGPIEQQGLLDASESFALTTIEAAFSTSLQGTERSSAGLFAAAQRYIKRHLPIPELSPDAVAAAIGCSRSTLYRLFDDQELSVQGYIRELRLQQFLHLLQQENRTLPIQTLALRCGLYDWSNVSRLFRQRFGMSPSEARAATKR
ncbi:helix-turn-helix domain-containing protein [Eoetvoesiella caeni]|uniref:AraC family transcriptional regulator n=1 Tax=Eoetvoesiella caeni TaxID=645616 RepID=A0A366H6X1_9BURK|nr:helix-turn-helix domain-containing protein [Eoetvoesiella caeni]MCI2810150.1 helix-turn-helix domain-containing protein [Eoetvoesiella caeni]NYT56470.1 helix-turn-helix domain-containing protein [Eoetvoesiella caeni]RBP37899.1 AraC family transcriptional regulator [Eoetvoesiella caeni]